MDEVRFVLADDGVEIEVNGTSMRELARRVELPHATAEGHPNLAGAYAGLLHQAAGPGARHFLGEPEETWFGDGDTVLLGCECGDAGCWPLTAVVTVTDTTVTWQGFRQGHRDWDLSALGPFAFDRAAYEEAVRRPILQGRS